MISLPPVQNAARPRVGRPGRARQGRLRPLVWAGAGASSGSVLSVRAPQSAWDTVEAGPGPRRHYWSQQLTSHHLREPGHRDSSLKWHEDSDITYRGGQTPETGLTSVKCEMWEDKYEINIFHSKEFDEIFWCCIHCVILIHSIRQVCQWHKNLNNFVIFHQNKTDGVLDFHT